MAGHLLRPWRSRRVSRSTRAGVDAERRVVDEDAVAHAADVDPLNMSCCDDLGGFGEIERQAEILAK